MTPAQEAGLCDHVWGLDELLAQEASQANVKCLTRGRTLHGARPMEKFCHACGFPFANLSKFCSECGTPVKWDAATQQMALPSKPLARDDRGIRRVVVMMLSFGVLVLLVVIAQFLKSNVSPQAPIIKGPNYNEVPPRKQAVKRTLRPSNQLSPAGTPRRAPRAPVTPVASMPARPSAVEQHRVGMGVAELAQYQLSHWGEQTQVIGRIKSGDCGVTLPDELSGGYCPIVLVDLDDPNVSAMFFVDPMELKIASHRYGIGNIAVMRCVMKFYRCTVE